MQALTRVIRLESGIRNIILSNPSKRNALSLAMLESLHKDIQREKEDARVIILSAEGDVFSSGHNLKELTSTEGSSHHTRVFEMCNELMGLVQNVPVPVLAQVRGLATAAGCQLVASCDIAVAADTARFATPGVKVGLFCSTPGVALGRSVPRKIAMKMLLTGEPISAQEAYLHGLVSAVVPEADLEKETVALARKISDSSHSVLSFGKACFNKQMKLDREEAYRLAGNAMVDNLRFHDAQEGIQAFVEKRKPKWSHTTNTVHG
ncbi:enoyl-CoA hydratase domain-containing protein 3, mitochondrial-like [Oscarella lobularis]|uniref:enoyl-CoA hydratase domain-containing protein 3, mitochondrial-like n=1 Tax=Oscarella lobularis TaxID=121494 RepID=UPI0033132DA6